jgi:hypothetical protein
VIFQHHANVSEKQTTSVFRGEVWRGLEEDQTMGLTNQNLWMKMGNGAVCGKIRRNPFQDTTTRKTTMCAAHIALKI